MTNIPMNLQFFADGGDGSGAQQAAAEQPVINAAPTPAATPVAPTAATPPLSVEALLDAIDKRSQRAENGVVRSFAQQYGMTEQEVTNLLKTEQEKRRTAIPADVQKQIDAANERANSILIAAESKSLCSEMGFLDSDVAYQLMDKTNVKVANGKVTGAREALEALKAAKPFLAAQPQPAAWGQKQGDNGAGGLSLAAQREKSYHERKYGKAKE